MNTVTGDMGPESDTDSSGGCNLINEIVQTCMYARRNCFNPPHPQEYAWSVCTFLFMPFVAMAIYAYISVSSWQSLSAQACQAFCVLLSRQEIRLQERA